MKKWWLIILGVVVILGIYFASTYNSLVGKSQTVDNQWAQVETQYQRRFDLIPNLVKSTEAVLKQEQKVFGDLARARSQYAGARTPNDRAEAATQVESALSRLLVIVENYPQLRSNETVQSLMDELAGTENRIAVERRRYNDTVRDYNVSVTRFPTMLAARLLGYNQRAYFQSAQGAAKVPEVNLNP